MNDILIQDGNVTLFSSTLTSMKSYGQKDWNGNDYTLVQKMPDLADGKLARLSRVEAKLFDTNGNQIAGIRADTKTGKLAYAVSPLMTPSKNGQITIAPGNILAEREKHAG